MTNLMTNEMMSEEQLDGVAGGNTKETANDSRFLNSLNGSTDRYGEWKIVFGDHDAEIGAAWAALGITTVIHSGDPFSGGSDNQYFYKTKEITHEQARIHAMAVVGKQMKYEDWHW